MAAKAEQRSLWDQLHKSEQERIKRQLKQIEASTPVKPEGGKRNGFQLRGYIRCELAAADKDAFRVWEAEQTVDAIGGQLLKVADSGYLVKLGENGPSFQASLCAATTGQSWDGYVLTGHASSAVRAAMLVVYKHAVMMACDWSAWMVEDGEDFLR